MLTTFLTTLSVVWLILALLSTLAAEIDRRRYYAKGFRGTNRETRWWFWPATCLAAVWILACVIQLFL